MKNCFKKYLGVILSVLIISCYAFTGCGSKTQQTSANKDESKTVTVTDGLGRKITLDKPVNKILTNYAIATQMVFALGSSDKLVGLDNKPIQEPFASKINSKKKGTKSKNSFNIEAAMSANPDLILINPKQKNLVKNIESHNLKVFVIKAENLDQLKDTMKNLGKALDKQKEADSFVTYYNTTIDTMKNNTKDLKDSQKPKVYLAGSSLFSTCGKDMYQNSIISLAGGKNVGENLQGKWSKISVEQLVKWNPDVIVLTQYSGTKPEDVFKNKSLQGINAVKNKKVYMFPSKTYPWDIPAPLSILGIEWLGTKINPDKFKDIDIQSECNKVFKTFYNKSFTETLD